MERTRKRDWCGWLGQQGGQALTYVAILALACGLIGLFVEDKVREIDGLSAAVVGAGSDLLLRTKECQARERLEARMSVQQPHDAARKDVAGNGQDFPSVDCFWRAMFGAAPASASVPHPNSWDVTVVLFGDADLDALELPYPVPYQAHAEVLDMLVAYRPAAIFVDFMFLQERTSEPAGTKLLLDVLAQARAQNVPIVMALPDSELMKNQGPASREKVPWLVDRFAGCADFAALTPLKLHGPLGLIRYPAQSKVHLRVEPARESLWQHLLRGPVSLRPEKERPIVPPVAEVEMLAVASPAFAVADALTRSRSRPSGGVMPAASAAPAAGAVSEGAPASQAVVPCLDMVPAVAAAEHRLPDRSTMEILWRTGANERRSWVDGCGPHPRMIDGSFLERQILKWEEFDRKLKMLRDGYSPTFCPYQTVVSVKSLLDGDIDDAGRRARFTGRVVAYGANFLGALDAVRTPIGEHTPGVFIHAMAIHNLLLLREDGYKLDEYWRRVIFIVVASLVAAVLAVLERNAGPRRAALSAPVESVVSGAMSAPKLLTWFKSLSRAQRAGVIGRGLALAASLFAFAATLYLFNRIVAVAVLVSVVLLWRLSLRTLSMYVPVVFVVTVFGFHCLRLGSLGILLVIGLFLLARKLDEGFGRLGARLREPRTLGQTWNQTVVLIRDQNHKPLLLQSCRESPESPGHNDEERHLAARLIQWLDRRREASSGPPTADSLNAQSTQPR